MHVSSIIADTSDGDPVSDVLAGAIDSRVGSSITVAWHLHVEVPDLLSLDESLKGSNLLGLESHELVEKTVSFKDWVDDEIEKGLNPHVGSGDGAEHLLPLDPLLLAHFVLHNHVHGSLSLRESLT